MGKTVYVTCPFCEGMMEIEAGSGKIVQKWKPGEKNGDGEDKMSSALRKMEEDKERRKDLFSVKKNELADQKEKLNNMFNKQVDKAKEEGVERPLNPFDLE